MGTDPPLPHRFGLTSVSQLGRMVYLAYMQDPNAADKVKIMFEIWKSCQNLKHSTATTHF
jgi:quinol monooxygenase YgiN